MSETTTRTEVIPKGRAVWRPENAYTYQCPFCLRPIFSQYEGDEIPTVECEGGPLGSHTLTWQQPARHYDHAK